MKHRLSLAESANYHITVQGYVSQRWADHLGLSIAHQDDSDLSVTTLSGPVVDQAALMGILNSLYGMGFPLLAIECETCFGKEVGNDE
jgi:aconitase A